ncbi:hypothetical protein EI42_01831 [Thermosporothrix hazakensis]|jgi:hypothetical protein|uniref:Intracellular septation protein A n=2 Tax=Thermosporothrix TaxID=768650 RepID=A0A326UAX7_THEHA|nr:VC0807 family protein [Thermosporothrix hazakensis]PZW32739.1 hypothetical protein EI42_01831 [Thermosporothrix hazakensis]BBH87654.1 hypothetical protein KTC_24050 [Thermosporothrix sp. COM3]GCE50097.1 hypothetical protein KTH_49660 [Thermosporothrix hazakensis]
MKNSFRGLIISLVVTAAVPYLLFLLLTQQMHMQELLALGVISMVPLLYTLKELIGKRSLDIIGLISLADIVVSIVLLLLVHNAQLYIATSSLLQGVFGIICFLSLFFSKPFMFYVIRQFATGNDPEKVAQFNQRWQQGSSSMRHSHRVLTVFWGSAFLLNFLSTAIFACTLPLSVAVGVTKAFPICVVALAMFGTVNYIRRQKAARAAMTHQA